MKGPTKSKPLDQIERLAMGDESMIEELLAQLANQGCWPCISRRSETLWRAHVNQAGNFWAEDHSPFEALRIAVLSWCRAGKPQEGMASLVDAERQKGK